MSSKCSNNNETEGETTSVGNYDIDENETCVQEHDEDMQGSVARSRG